MPNAKSCLCQTPLEATLTEEEARRNSKRIELLYVSSSNPITPDIFQLADQHRGADEAARAEISAPMNAQLTGTLPICLCTLHSLCKVVQPPLHGSQHVSQLQSSWCMRCKMHLVAQPCSLSAWCTVPVFTQREQLLCSFISTFWQDLSRVCSDLPKNPEAFWLRLFVF